MRVTQIKPDQASVSTQKVSFLRRQFINPVKDFWPTYLKYHSDRRTRIVHALGTTGGVLGGGTMVAFGEELFALFAIPLTYATLWWSHKKFEKNKPATLEGWRQALKSIPCDFYMTYLTVTGKINAELKRLGIGDAQDPKIDKTENKN